MKTLNLSMLRSTLALVTCGAALSLAACGPDLAADDTEATSAALTACAPQAQPIVLATASSQQAGAFAPKYAIDGVSTTRWSSTQTADQWLALDLGQVVNVSGVNINWQTAYSKTFSVDWSRDGATWTPFILSGATKSGVQSLSGSSRTRYVRIHSTVATSWGNVSIIDVQVIGTLDSACGNMLKGPWVFASEDFEPSTFDASTVYSISGNSIAFRYSGKQFTNSTNPLGGIHFKQPVQIVQGGHYRLRLDVTPVGGATATLWWASLSGAASPTDLLDLDAYSSPSGAIDFDVTAAPGAAPVIELVNRPITVFPGAGAQDFNVTATLTKTN